MRASHSGITTNFTIYPFAIIMPNAFSQILTIIIYSGTKFYYKYAIIQQNNHIKTRHECN